MVTIIQKLETLLASPQYNGLPSDVIKIVLKEQLQAYILHFIYSHEQYRKLRFYGGTCARVVYNLNRLSEDIDLDNTEGVDTSNLGDDLLEYFRARLLFSDTEMYTQTGELSISRWVLKLPILHQLGLSNFASEKLHIRIDVSSQKQTANLLSTPILHHGMSYAAYHFDLPSLMAGKMLACLERQFHLGNSQIVVKGRDFYDLLWYMQQKIDPLEEKLLTDGQNSYSKAKAFRLLEEKIISLSKHDLSPDLLKLFPEQAFVKEWLEHFHSYFSRFVEYYR